MATTNLGKVSVTPKGEYDPLITYERLDIINHNGSSYIVKQASTGVTPIEGEFYALIAEKGDGGSFVKKAYKTYAAMDADKVNIPANSSVDVTNDPDESKNGAYIYDGAAFTRSQYDSKVVTDKIISDTAIAVQNAINNTAVEGGVLADTFVVVDGNQTQRELNQKIVRNYQSVAQMIADTKLSVGQHVRTINYTVTGDNGGNNYITEENNGQAIEGGRYISLSNNLIARAVFENSQANLAQFGAQYETDIAEPWRNFISACHELSLKGIVTLDKDYYVSDETTINKSGISLEFYGTGFIKLTKNTTTGGILIVVDRSVGGSIVSDVTLHNPRVDGGNTGYKGGYVYGENGIGGTDCRGIKVIGGHVKNCYRGSSAPTGTGGKGVQFENGVRDIQVDGLVIDSCTIAMETGGIRDLEGEYIPANSRNSFLVQYDNIIAKNCDVLLSTQQSNTPPDTSPEVNLVSMSNVLAYNCGGNSVPEYLTPAGLIAVDRASNTTLRNVICFNDAEYGEIPTVVRLYSGTNNNFDITFYGASKYLVLNETITGFGASGINEGNKIKITHKGNLDTAIFSPVATSSRVLNNTYNVLYDSPTAKLINSNMALPSVYIEATNTKTQKRLNGYANVIYLNTLGVFTQTNHMNGSYTINKTSFSYNAKGDVITSDGTELAINLGVSPRITFSALGTALFNIPKHVNITAAKAAGLLTGNLYMDNAGSINIVGILAESDSYSSKISALEARVAALEAV